MSCVRCASGVWVCTEGTADCDGGPGAAFVEGKQDEPSAWSCSFCADLAADTTYYVKCKPGQCEAKVETTSGATLPWIQIGSLSLDEAGCYAVYCRTGGGTGNACDVWITKLAAGTDCPDDCTDGCSD